MSLDTCLIPAAGQGMRARPKTELQPKAMLMVENKPILQNTIELARDQLGIKSFVIITGHLSEMIKDYFNDGINFGVNIRYVHNDSIDKGLAWSIYLGRHFVADRFLVLLGDEFYQNTNHYILNNRSFSGTLALCGVIQTDDIELIKQNYTLEYSGKRVSRLFEKPDRVDNDIMGTGTFVLSKDIFTFIYECYKTSTQYVEFITLLDMLCQQGHRVDKFLLSGNYVNINDIAALEKANGII